MCLSRYDNIESGRKRPYIGLSELSHSQTPNGDKSLPPLANAEFQRILSRIDVLWLDRDQVVAAYEIEHTTDISTGLLRLYDLGALCPLTSHLCVVVPRDCLRKIQFELSRPAFNRQDVRNRCGIITEELLLEGECPL
jgi:hypothetical protein